jgi:transcriptional regulator with XRE-family HTH domain
MAFDLHQFGAKLKKYRDQLQVSIAEISISTDIEEERLQMFEGGNTAPTGDEVLVLADFYKCDYNFFISNDRLAPFEQLRVYTDAMAKISRKKIADEFKSSCFFASAKSSCSAL